MKLKKVVATLSLVLASTFVLAACGGKDDAKKDSSSKEATSSVESKKESKVAVELKDGEYKLEEKKYDDKGWKAEFGITVAEGKITKSTFDYVNEEGKLKSEDKDYQEMMEKQAGTGPADFIPELNDALVKEQSADVDAVTGATHTSESFKEYAQKLIDAAEKGDTKTIEIDNKAK
ncbi:FMN-binding protein [Isobaculum melis]|uniref:Major membrane immunogen, membrane-anchored lipoprotein n=1 Tax=Isobaculum melis TaxID=142588 RepID=A0A1H9SHJ1_9LACT|nr:FMN-binding protein [Isobaculum melis]SER84085.1 Major membrane immunogen, membrane-anchored lipoprotein [Isobaculum melis]